MSKTLKKTVGGSIPSTGNPETLHRGSSPSPSTVGSNPATDIALPDDLAALFAEAAPSSPADTADLQEAADRLRRDPAFVASHAKGLVVEDILHAMEATGIKQNALAAKIGKSRQYIGKILAEDRGVNFTIDTLAGLSAALGVQLCVRMLPPSEKIFFVRRVVATEVTPTPTFPDATSTVVPFAADEFEPRNVIQFSDFIPDDQAALSA
jgi:transcriptional regulator with XRE-family HTH domain